MISEARPAAQRPSILRRASAMRIGAAVLVVATIATGCSKSSGATGSSAGSSSSSSSASGTSQRQLPGASGELVALSGQTLQVQNTTSQTSVTYSGTTTFSNTVTTTSSALKVGLCASVRQSSTSSSGASGASGSTGTQPTSIDAMSVTLSDPVNGRCGGFGGGGVGGGGFGGGGFGARPSGAPSGAAPNASGAPSGRPGGAGRGGFGATGVISSVSGSSFVVTVERRARSNSSSTPSASPTTDLVTAHFTSATTFSRQQRATASALQVGLCVTALGKADDTGAIAATSISLRPKVNGTCSFGGFGA